MIAIFFIADRWLKILAVAQAGNPGTRLIGDFLSFSFTPNRYIAFSLPLSGWFIIGLILGIIVVLIFTIIYLIINKKSDILTILLLTIILLGAISNMLDRYLYGYVIDYLSLRYFTVFNLADAMISVGVIIVLFKNFAHAER